MPIRRISPNNYEKRNVGISTLLKLLKEGKSLEEMCKITGKHNYWIQKQFESAYGSRITFKQGRNGGIFLDNVKMNTKENKQENKQESNKKEISNG